MELNNENYDNLILNNQIKNNYNGRIHISNKLNELPNTNNLFAMYDKIPTNQCISLRENNFKQWEETPLSRAFFSTENIQILQNGIRAGVFYKSNGSYIIGPQDCDSLRIIMRSIFLQHSVNLPTNITQQIQSLNQMVLDYCIQHVYSEAIGYMNYLHDISTLPTPLANPILSKQYDKRTYKLPNWF
jgi:hypothetical protein